MFIYPAGIRGSTSRVGVAEKVGSHIKKEVPMDRRDVRRAAMPFHILTRVASAVLLLIVVQPKAARALEIVPSVGITRSVESDEVTKQVGLALRSNVVPHVLKAEFGGSYRSEKRDAGAVEAKMWPVTRRSSTGRLWRWRIRPARTSAFTWAAE